MSRTIYSGQPSERRKAIDHEKATHEAWLLELQRAQNRRVAAVIRAEQVARLYARRRAAARRARLARWLGASTLAGGALASLYALARGAGVIL